MARRPTSHEHFEEAHGELNIIPFLDVLMNLIIFMLLSLTGLAAWGVVKATAPPTSLPSERSSQPAELLTVGIARSGYFIAAAGGVLPGEAEGPTIPLRSGQHDSVALTERLRAVKAAFPASRRLIVTADADIPYELVIATMDAARETPEHEVLFPDVSLALLEN